MVSTKRVILADGPRLLREMLHQVIDQAHYLEVVQELPNSDELGSAINRFDPEWVILTQPFNRRLHGWIDSCLASHPSLRFIFLSPDQNYITMKWQMSYEENLPDLSLKEFIQILERDREHI